MATPETIPSPSPPADGTAATSPIQQPLPSPTSSLQGGVTGGGSSGSIRAQCATPPSDQIIDTLKCPICLDWFVEPILLDCSHSLCLVCARSLALHDGGSNTAEITCPLCKEVTAVSGGDKAKELEDALIAAALKRFDVHPPRKNRVRIEDLKACYEAYAKNGLVPTGDEPKPSALHIWRAVVAKMESQMQELLNEKTEGERKGSTADSQQQPQEDPVVSSTSPVGPEGSNEEGGDEKDVNETAATASATVVEDPMNKLRFKKNILLNNLVTHFKEQQLQCSDASPNNNTANTSQSFNGTGPQIKSEATAGSGSTGPLPPSMDDNDLELDLDLSLGLGMDGSATELLELATASHDHDQADLLLDMDGGEEGELPDPVMLSGASPIPRKPHTPDPTLEGLPPPGDASGRSDGSRHIWVGNLGPGVKEQHLRDAFQVFGGLESVRLLRRSTMNMVGFIHFCETEDAIRAKTALDGTFLRPPASGPHPIKIQYQATGNNPPGPTLRVHNISPEGPYVAHDDELRRVFSLFGRVRTVSINNRTHIGIVGFDNVQDATAAIRALHNTPIKGHHIFIDFVAVKEQERERGSQRGRREGGAEGGPRGRGPPSDRDRGGGRPPSRKVMLPSPRGCPPFEVFPDEVDKLREMVDLMQHHLPRHQRQSLEDALQNRDLYDTITQIIGRNRRDMDKVINELKLELNIGRGGPPPPPDSFRGGPPPSAPPGYPDRGGHLPPPPPSHGERPFYPPPDDYRGGGPPLPPPPHYPPHDEARFSSPRGGPPRGRDDAPRLPPYDRRGRSRDRGGPPPGPPHQPPPSRWREEEGLPPGGGGGYRGRSPPPGPCRGDERGGGRYPPMDDRRGGGPPGPVDHHHRGVGGGGRSPPPPHVQQQQRRGGRSRSPPPHPGGRGGGFKNNKRGREGPGRSRSPPSRRRRGEGPPGRGGGGDYPPPPPGPDYGRGPRSPVPSPSRRVGGGGGGRRPGEGGPPPPMPGGGQGLHHHQHQQQQQHPPHHRPPPPPLQAEVDEFLQTVISAPSASQPPPAHHHHHHHPPPPLAGYGAPPPSSHHPPPHHQGSQVPGSRPRIFLDSTSAQSYPCYEGVLTLVKNALNPFYRSQAISKDDFKRIAEETTLLLTQTLLEHRLENRPDVPPHYESVAEDMIRAALPRPPR